MKKGISTLSLLLLATIGFAQTVLNLYPKGTLLDFSAEGEQAYNAMEAKMEVLFAKMDSDYIPEKLTPEELAYYEKHIDELMVPYWDTEGDGCSWYCGGGPYDVEASSFLSSYGAITYEPWNAHDFSYKNAWVEGVAGYGIGEYLTYYFTAQSPRITEIRIANGYVKSQTDWENNSRVKTLKIYLNDKPYAIVHLEDCRCESSIKVKPIGNGEEKYNLPEDAPGWTLKFEIVEVYPGKKYDDTVISEIYFDGIDVH